jgi:trk system potassium uptake protein TrkA
VISPEREVAAAINRRLQVPGAFDIIPLAGGKVSLIGVHCTEDTPVINTPLRQLTGLFPDLRIVVVAIVRDDRAEVPAPHDQMYAGDDVYFVADTGHLSRALAVFGHEEREARRVVIVGGGNIGLSLARMMEEHSHGVSLKIIEHNKQRAESVARTLERAVVIHGDVLDSEILEESNVQGADTIVAVTNDDEVNILASMLAKRHGCRRAVTLINKASYSPLVSSLAIDTVVSPQAITVSTILQHVRRGRIRSVHSLGEGLGEIIEVDALETSALAGVPIRDAKLPDDVLIGAIVRDGEVVTPRADTVIKPRDRVIVFAAPGAVRKVEKLFAVRLEFF